MRVAGPQEASICVEQRCIWRDLAAVLQADLYIALEMWGKEDDDTTDPRADVRGDQFVGQTDLDYVLDGWGNTIPSAGGSMVQTDSLGGSRAAST
jgi:hypothetical protein